MKIISCMIPEIWSTTDRIFSHFWPFFALLQPPPLPLPNKAEKQNFEKTPGDIIILHKCTISDNHMIYGSRDMKCTRQNFLSSCPIFCPFTPLTAWKMKCTKKQSVPKIMTIGYTVPQIWHMTNAIVIFHFGLYFSLLCPPPPPPPPPLTAQKMKISKKWKKCLEISSQVYQKSWS